KGRPRRPGKFGTGPHQSAKARPSRECMGTLRNVLRLGSICRAVRRYLNRTSRLTTRLFRLITRGAQTTARRTERRPERFDAIRPPTRQGILRAGNKSPDRRTKPALSSTRPIDLRGKGGAAKVKLASD